MRIGLFAEGYTDQLLIEAVMAAVLGPETEVNFVQPLAQGPDTNGSYAPGGWTVLFGALRRGEHKKALQFNDIVVIHVDSDVCRKKGFDVPKVADPEKQAEAVEDRLWSLLGEEFRRVHGHRVVFAVAVDEVECWLMPMIFPDQVREQGKTTGCLEAASKELLRQGKQSLQPASRKDPKAYQALARGLGGSENVMGWAAKNPSLGRFVETLKRRQWEVVAAPTMESPEATG